MERTTIGGRTYERRQDLDAYIRVDDAELVGYEDVKLCKAFFTKDGQLYQPLRLGGQPSAGGEWWCLLRRSLGPTSRSRLSRLRSPIATAHQRGAGL
jgi:hypothetical protein